MQWFPLLWAKKMKLSEDTLITYEKLTLYLLIQRKRNDKSQWLAQAGYSLKNWQVLEKVVLKKDIPKRGLKKGDVATIVEHHPVSDGEDGYSLELFNALGDTIAVITVPESSIEPLTEDEIFSIRSFATAR